MNPMEPPAQPAPDGAAVWDAAPSLERLRAWEAGLLDGTLKIDRGITTEAALAYVRDLIKKREATCAPAEEEPNR